LLSKDGAAVRSASEVVKQGMSGVLHKNCAIEICSMSGG
jgi:hypothetical protein